MRRCQCLDRSSSSDARCPEVGQKAVASGGAHPPRKHARLGRRVRLRLLLVLCLPPAPLRLIWRARSWRAVGGGLRRQGLQTLQRRLSIRLPLAQPELPLLRPAGTRTEAKSDFCTPGYEGMQ